MTTIFNFLAFRILSKIEKIKIRQKLSIFRIILEIWISQSHWKCPKNNICQNDRNVVVKPKLEHSVYMELNWRGRFFKCVNKLHVSMSVHNRPGRAWRQRPRPADRDRARISRPWRRSFRLLGPFYKGLNWINKIFSLDLESTLNVKKRFVF